MVKMTECLLLFLTLSLAVAMLARNGLLRADYVVRTIDTRRSGVSAGAEVVIMVTELPGWLYPSGDTTGVIQWQAICQQKHGSVSLDATEDGVIGRGTGSGRTLAGSNIEKSGIGTNNILQECGEIDLHIGKVPLGEESWPFRSRLQAEPVGHAYAP